MGEPILRDGQWWYRSKKGQWLRWDAPTKLWRPTVLEPPPQPVPPPLPPEEGGPAYAQGAQTEPVKIRSSDPPKKQSASRAPNEPITETLIEQHDEFPMGPPDRNFNLGIAIGVGALALFLIVFAAVKIFGGKDEPAPAVDRGAAAKAEYIAAADELCSKARSVEASLSPPRSDKELLEFALRVQSIRTSLGRKITRLDAPKGDEKALTKMSKAYGSALRQLAITIEELRKGNDNGRARAGQRATALTDKFNKLADDYGFKECNHIGDPT